MLLGKPFQKQNCTTCKFKEEKKKKIVKIRTPNVKLNCSAFKKLWFSQSEESQR